MIQLAFSNRQSLPPGPSSAPWNVSRFASQTFRFLQDCKERYGNLFTVPMTGIKVVFSATPEGTQQIFTADQNLFDTVTGANVGIAVGENSLLVLSGVKHERERKLLMPAFHGARLATYGQLIQALTIEQCDRWQPQQKLTIEQESQAISLEIIIQVIFGVRKPEQVKLFREIVNEYLNAFTPVIIFFPALRYLFNGFGIWTRFEAALAKFDQILDQEIANRRNAAVEGEDILSLFLATRDEDGQPMSDQQIRDELKTLLMAGHETTASSIAWACYRLHSTPEVAAKLQAELAKLGTTPDPQALLKLPYLKAVCQETLRMCPPVPFSARLLKQPWTFCGVDLPAGAGVCAASSLTHFNPEIYPEPHSFRPERFIDRTYSPYEYFPFGGGSRRCLGAAFALYEMQIVLGTILARQKLSLADSKPVVPSPLGFTIRPQGGVKMIAEGKISL
jgi:cytochrome P450 family 110